MIAKLKKTGWFIKCFINRHLLLPYLIKTKPRLHIGCGAVRLSRFINIDIVATPATDIIHDCNDLSFIPSQSIKIIYAHAFIEHLFPDQVDRLLAELKRVLRKDGLIIFLGIPDFRTIARAYLLKKPGLVGKRFDLYHVYRYTHGAAHEVALWQNQLHKSLYDRKKLRELLVRTGFKPVLIFNYRYQKEYLPVNLGCIASLRQIKYKTKNKPAFLFLKGKDIGRVNLQDTDDVVNFFQRRIN
ncbi:class I SAM-dependent methyltransferase [Patescibacteria group bacterium]|nr:class I SAM-dependent methyltransferase [Patescibacteria group bacterium]MCL5091561.1 class I SAM-dependent methyltransferase [Patescibacteria group bacterium]